MLFFSGNGESGSSHTTLVTSQQNTCHSRQVFKVVKAVVSILVSLVVGPAINCGQLNAAEGDTVLTELPRSESDLAQQVRLCIELLKQNENFETRTQHLRYLFANTLVVEQHAAELYSLVENTLSDISPNQMPAYSSVVAHFPELYDTLVNHAEITPMRDRVLLVLVRNVPRYTDAKRFSNMIQDDRDKRYAIDALVEKAPSLEEKLNCLGELVAYSKIDSGVYISYTKLRAHAAESPDIIIKSVVDNVPLASRIGILRWIGESMIVDGHEVSASRFFEAAWRDVLIHPEPWVPARSLLSTDPAMKSPDNWLRKFDEHIMPRLVESKSSIDSLFEVIRFDLAMLIDRSEKAFSHRPLTISYIFPHVMEGAFTYNPDIVLTWIEDDQRQVPRGVTDAGTLRDQTIFEISEFLAVRSSRSDGIQPSHFHRLCKVSLKIESPELRLATLAALASNLHALDFAVPMDVSREGRRLLDNKYAPTFEELLDDHNKRYFHLLDPKQQVECLKRLLDTLRTEKTTDLVAPSETMIRLIESARFSDDERMGWYQELAKVAALNGNYYIQAKITQIVVPTNPELAIKTLWALLPPDRGRTEKTLQYFDWTPPPRNPSDAVSWLESNMRSPDEPSNSQLNFIASLYGYVSMMPEGDRNPTRIAIARILSRFKKFDYALGVIETIKSTQLRTDARYEWVASQ